MFLLRKDKVTAEMERTWDNEILTAERQRVADVTAMDIMQTKSTTASLDQAAAMNVLEQTCEEVWIQLGLHVEEKQWVQKYYTF